MTVAVLLDKESMGFTMPVRLITRSVMVFALVGITSIAVSAVSSTSARPATPPNTTSLFTDNRSLKLDTGGAGPMMVATGGNSVFVVGTFDRSKGAVDDLIRIDLGTWRIAAAARFPNETSVAFGDSALWWTTGQNAFNIPAPESGRALLKINPTNLVRERTFLLPDRTVLVTVRQRVPVGGDSHDVLQTRPSDRADPIEGLAEFPTDGNVDVRPRQVSSRVAIDRFNAIARLLLPRVRATHHRTPGS